MKSKHLTTYGKLAYLDNNGLRENVLIRLSSLPTFYITKGIFSGYVREELEYSRFVKDTYSNLKTISERV
jgi:hypothetical protein